MQRNICQCCQNNEKIYGIIKIILTKKLCDDKYTARVGSNSNKQQRRQKRREICY
jgi:hypothetical protein